MASEEQRISDLEEKAIQQEAASITLLGIVKEMSQKQDETLGSVRSILAHELVVDSHLGTIDQRMNAQRVQIDNMQVDMQRSFRQVAETMVPREDIADIQRHMDTLNAKMDQVIALLKRGE